MLRKNWNTITTYLFRLTTAMPPIQKNSIVPKKEASKVWRYLGDNLDGGMAKCLLHLLINIHHLRFSLCPMFAKAPSKPWETTYSHTTRRSISWWSVLRGPAKCWKHHESQFSLIAKPVKVVFPVPAASSKSERMWSWSVTTGHPQKGQVEFWGGGGPRGGEV